jgi:hypothetical protein
MQLRILKRVIDIQTCLHASTCRRVLGMHRFLLFASMHAPVDLGKTRHRRNAAADADRNGRTKGDPRRSQSRLVELLSDDYDTI